MAFDVRIPAIILVTMVAELRCATLNNTLVLMYFIKFFNQYVFRALVMVSISSMVNTGLIGILTTLL